MQYKYSGVGYTTGMDIHEAIRLLSSNILAADIIITRVAIVDICKSEQTDFWELSLDLTRTRVIWGVHKTELSIQDISAKDYILVRRSKL